MIAERDDIVTGGVHHFDGVKALGHADIARALAVVARINEDDLGALGLIIGLERGDVGVAGDCAVHIVGVQDHGLARHRRFFGHDFGLSIAKPVTVRLRTIAIASRTDRNLRIVFSSSIFSLRFFSVRSS